MITDPKLIAKNMFRAGEFCQQLENQNAMLLMSLGLTPAGGIVFCASDERSKPEIISILRRVANEIEATTKPGIIKP